MKCANCGHSTQQALKSCIDEALQVLVPAAGYYDTPNTAVCRGALRKKYGSKRARELIGLVLEDRIIDAKGEQPRRHIMLLNKHPLKLLAAMFDEPCVQK